MICFIIIILMWVCVYLYARVCFLVPPPPHTYLAVLEMRARWWASRCCADVFVWMTNARAYNFFFFFLSWFRFEHVYCRDHTCYYLHYVFMIKWWPFYIEHNMSSGFRLGRAYMIGRAESVCAATLCRPKITFVAREGRGVSNLY